MNRWIPYLGSLGLAALVAGGLLRLFQPERDRVWASLLIAGLVLVVFHLGARWREVMTLVGRRQTRYGANLGLLVVLVVGILIAVNYLANRHNKRWDLTAAKQYTLSDQTVKILEGLDRDLSIIVFEQKDRAQAAQELLDQYRYQNRRISVEVVDPEANPARAAKYQTSTDNTIPFGTIIIDSGEKVERVSSATEQDVTNAIIKVLKEGQKKIYFVEGHGEKSLEESSATGISAIKAKLEESNYLVETFHPLQAMQEGKIHLPEDATVLVVAGAQRDFLPAEIEALRGYLKQGGKALFLVDPENQGQTPNLVSLLQDFDVRLGSNVVIDVSGVGQLFGYGPGVPLAVSYGFHPITERFGNLATVYPFVRTVESAGSSIEGIRVTELVKTSENSWAEENMEQLASGRVSPDEGEKEGPLSLAVAVTVDVSGAKTAETADGSPADVSEAEASETEAEPAATEDGEEGSADSAETDGTQEENTEGRIVVVGDSDFIENRLIGGPVANMDLFLNMVNWTAQDEDLISIRPKEPEDRRIFLTQQQQKNVFYLSLLIIPGLVLAAGVIVWWERR